MNKYSKLSLGFLIILFSSISTLVIASNTINYSKSLPPNALKEKPNYVLLNLYEGKEDTIPIVTQTYLPGEWQLTQSADGNILRVSMDNVSYLDEFSSLWAEIEVDGQVVGPREQIAVIAPGISAPGLIESTAEGFKYPDATVQTTAGISAADLSVHQSNPSAHHPWPIGTAEIANGTILPEDLNASQNFTIGGLTIDGSFQTYIKSAGDIEIWDDYNGFRWYNAARSTQLFSIEVQQGTANRIRDVERNRYLLYSNANGIGIGTTSPASSHAVTMPSLNVTGNLEIGLTRESSAYELSLTATCHSAGNLTCYYGSGTVSCPVGTRVLGGGSDGTSSARYGSISMSYPSSTTAWSCASSYDLSGVSDTCYAICARLE